MDYAIKSIRKRIGKTTLTVIGVSILISLVIVVSGIVNYQKETMNSHASAGGAGRIVLQPFIAGKNHPALSVSMIEHKADQLSEISDLQNDLTSKMIFFSLQPPLYPSEPPELLLTGIEPGKENALLGNIANQTRAAIGTTCFETGVKQTVILGYDAREYLEKDLEKVIPGVIIELLGEPFTVIGVLEQSNDKVLNHSCLIPLETAQSLLGTAGFVSSVITYSKRIEDMEKLKEKILKIDQKLMIITSENLMRNAREGIELFENMISGISIVVLIASGLLLTSVFVFTIGERRQEIGILRAIGMSKWLIMKTIFLEVFIISFLGTMIGCFISGVVLRYFLLENLFNLNHILGFMPYSIVLAFLGSIIPVVKAIGINPIDALRYE